MFGSKKYTFNFLLSLLTLLVLTIPTQSTLANAQLDENEIVSIEEGVEKIVIKIIIIIKKKKKGIVEVTGMRVAGNAKALENNEVLAQAYVEGGKFYVQPLRGEGVKNQFIMPRGFKVDSSVSLKLGSKKSILLAGGKIDFTRSKLGNFEIQD